MKPTSKAIILKDVPMMSVDRGQCTLVLALQAALKYLGQTYDYDYLMGVSGAGFMFYVNLKQPADVEWCEVMRDRWLHVISDAVGHELRLIDIDEALFDSDPEKHFYSQFVKDVIASLEAGRPCLAYTCFDGPQWDIISGFSEGRLLCRSIHNPLSTSGLIDQIQPYEHNTLWPSKIILIGQEKSISSRLDLIRRSIEVGLEIGRGLTDGEGKTHSTGPSAMSVWADLLHEEPDQEATRGHQRLVKTLIDARISLERFLRWVQVEAPRELGRQVRFARNHFARSFETLTTIDITEESLAEEGSRLRIADDIRSLEGIETQAFNCLEIVYDGMKKGG